MAKPEDVGEAVKNIPNFQLAILAGVVTLIVYWLLAKYKAHLDALAAQNKVTSDRHLKRSEHLSNIIGAISKARWVLTEAHKVGHGIKGLDKGKETYEQMHERDMTIYHEMIREGTDSLIEALAESDQYGNVPAEAKLKNQRLEVYVGFVTNCKLKHVYCAENAHEMQDLVGYAKILINDLQELKAYEDACATFALKRKWFRLGLSILPNLELPCLRKMSGIMPLDRTDVGNHDFSGLEAPSQTEAPPAFEQKRLEPIQTIKVTETGSVEA